MGERRADTEPLSGRVVLAREAVPSLRAAILKAQCNYLGLLGEGLLPEVTSDLEFRVRGVVTLVTPPPRSAGDSVVFGDLFSIPKEIRAWVEDEGTPTCDQCGAPSQRRTIADAALHYNSEQGTLVLGVPIDRSANLGPLSVAEVAEMFEASRVLIEDKLHNLATDTATGERIVGAMKSSFEVILASFTAPLSREEQRRLEEVCREAFTHGLDRCELALLRKNVVAERFQVGASPFYCSVCQRPVKNDDATLDAWSVKGRTLTGLLGLSAIDLYGLASHRPCGARLKCVVDALNLVDLDQTPLSLPVALLSSGERIRARLAQLLVDGFSDSTIVIDDPVYRGTRHQQCVEAVAAELISSRRTAVISVENLGESVARRALTRGTVEAKGEDIVALKLAPHCLTWLEGESGAGKSLLLRAIERSPQAHVHRIWTRSDGIGPRDRIADRLGITDAFIREAVATYEARSRGVSASHFSRTRGEYRCNNCKGNGWSRPATDDGRIDAIIEHCMPEFVLKCPSCEGVGLSGAAVGLKVSDTTFDELFKCTVREGRDRLSVVDDIRETLDAVIECGGESWMLGDSVLLRDAVYSPRIELSLLYRRLRSVSKKKRKTGHDENLLLLIELESIDHDIVEVLRTVASLCRGCLVDAGSSRFQADGDCSILMTTRERDLLLASSASSKGVQLTWHERH